MEKDKKLTHRGIGDRFLATKAHLQGKITYASAFFADVVGYSEKQLVGQNHNLVRHPDMPKSVFKLFWDILKSDNGEFWGYVKNHTADGGHYWVLAHVIPNYDSSGTKIGYHSNRRLAGDEAIQIFERLYAQIRAEESKGGIAAGEAFLQKKLNELGVSYDQFVFSI